MEPPALKIVEPTPPRTVRRFPSYVFKGEQLDTTLAERFCKAQLALVCNFAFPRRAIDVAQEPKLTPAILQLADWYDEEECEVRPIVVLSGGRGVGKTVAMVWLAYWRIVEQRPTFVTAPELARMPRQERFAFVERAFSNDDEFSDALLLDDLGAEHPDSRSTWIGDFDEIFDRLYRTNHQAIITTNLKPAAFAKRYGARVRDRFNECGKWIDIPGESMRGARDQDERG